MATVAIRLKSAYWAMRWRTGLRLSRVGERFGIDALTYNAAVMDLFGHIAMEAAPVVAESVTALWPDVRRLVDFGCGTGHFVHAFRQRGVDAIGLERSSYARQYARTKLDLILEEFDLTSAVQHPVKVDCALSLEVAEHLTPQLGDKLVDVLTEAAPIVVFSAAHPGQGGMGHINEQPGDYWRDRFVKRRYRYLDQASAKIRQDLVQAPLSPWLRENLMAFSRVEGAYDR